MCDQNNKTCGTKNFATCVKYEKGLPTTSLLYNNDCVDLEQTTSELYSITTELKTNTDVSGLLNGCIVFSSPKTTKSVLEQMYLKICDLQQQITALKPVV